MSQFNERSQPKIRSACGSIHSGCNHSNQHNQSPIRSVDIKQDLPLTSVDSWIDTLNPVEDTRTFSCSYSEIDLITKLATTQILPQITIASFDGSPLDWMNFIVQFKEIIHDQPHLSGPQRMIYLLQSLSGEAKQSILGLAHDWSGYVFGLKRLKLLFGQQSSIVNAHIATVTRQQEVEDSDIAGLTTFYYNINDCVIALLRLNFKADVYSSTFLGLVLQRLPNRLRSKLSEFAWSMRSKGEEPNVMDFRNWLQDRVMAMKEGYIFEDSNKHEDTNGKSPSGPCRICQNTHRLNKCRHYINKSPTERLKVVQSNNLCTNCLGAGHEKHNCPSKLSCLVGDCNERHHTSLHDCLNTTDLESDT